MHGAEGKKPAWKGLYTVWFQFGDILEKGQLWRHEKGQSLAGWGEANRQRKDSQGSETTPRESLTVDACHYTFVQTHRMYDSKS